MLNLMKDFRFGIRMMLKAPGFTAIVVLTLALGTGANSAIFSLVNGVVLRPLPYREPERLVMVWSDTSRRGGGTDQEFTSYPTYLDWRDQNRTFEQMAAFAFGNVNI